MTFSLVAAVEEALSAFQGAAQAPMVAAAQARAPKHTGAFAASLMARSRQSSIQRYIEVFSDSQKPKAIWTYTGYTIEAKNKPNLVFQTYDGAWHSLKRVYHRPSVWPEEAILSIADDMVELLRANVIERLALVFSNI